MTMLKRLINSVAEKVMSGLADVLAVAILSVLLYLMVTNVYWLALGIIAAVVIFLRLLLSQE